MKSTTLNTTANRLENRINPQNEKNKRIEAFFEILKEVLIETQDKFEASQKDASVISTNFLNFWLVVI